MPIRFVVALACLILLPAIAESAAPPRSGATVATDLESHFAGKNGWIGGDAVYSVVLGPKRILWLFGDTLVGTVKDGRRIDTKMVNNTAAIQTGTGKDAVVRFIAGEKDGKPASLFAPSGGKGLLWPQDGIRIGDKLYLFLPRIEMTGKGGPFGFRHAAQLLGVVENPDDEPEKWRMAQHTIPFSTFVAKRIRSWGAAVLRVGEDVYVYGYDDDHKFGRRKLTTARVPAHKLGDFRAWRFRTSDGWSEKPEDAVGLADGLATEFSVSADPRGKGYILVYTDSGLGDRIVARFAGEPFGPWSKPVLLARCPEGKDKDVFCYSAKAHPWAAKGNELVISYCVNAWKFGRVFDDEKVYRPKFLRVPLAK